MASSLTSSLSFPSKQISSTRQLSDIVYFIFLILLLARSCYATIPSTTKIIDGKVSMTTFRRKQEMGFSYQGQMFNFFPKGTPIPHSGPSKRHNYVVDSTQN
ncbi:hypothetical protein PTKIN_Ptkin17bG0170200 [Pterospermum kingtungense]